MWIGYKSLNIGLNLLMMWYGSKTQINMKKLQDITGSEFGLFEYHEELKRLSKKSG